MIYKIINGGLFFSNHLEFLTRVLSDNFLYSVIRFLIENGVEPYPISLSIKRRPSTPVVQLVRQRV